MRIVLSFLFVMMCYTSSAQLSIFSDTTSNCLPDATFNFWCDCDTTNLYQWNFGDGTFSSSPTPSHTFSSPGWQEVSLFITDSLGAVLDSGTIDVYAIGILYEITLLQGDMCPNEELDFMTQTDLESMTWLYGDGTSDYITDDNYAHHTYTTGGVYTLTLISEHYCYTDTFYATVNIDSTLVPDLNTTVNPSVICPGGVFNYNMDPGAISYEWNLGNGIVDYSRSGSFSYTDEGLHDFSITATNGCGNSQVEVLSVMVEDGDEFTGSTSFYVSYSGVLVSVGDPVGCTYFGSMNNLSSLNIDWGDGFTEFVTSTFNIHSYMEEGSYEVILSVVDACGNDTLLALESQSVNVGCYNEEIEGLSLTIPDSYGCVNEPFEMSATGEGAYMTWIVNGDSISGVDEIIYEFDSAGLYAVDVYMEHACGFDTTLHGWILANENMPLPGSMSITSSTGGCPGDEVGFTLNDYGSAIEFDWQYGNGQSDVVTNNHGETVYNEAGSYIVICYVTNGCITEGVQATIEISEDALFDLAGYEMGVIGLGMICPGDSLVFYVDPSPASVFWDFGDGITSDQNYDLNYAQNMVNATNHAYSELGVTSVTATMENGCGNTAELNMSVNLPVNNVGSPNLPILYVSPDETYCAGMPVTFGAENGTNYEFNFGDGSPTEVYSGAGYVNVEHVYLEEGNYTTTLRATNGCAASGFVQKTVQIECISGVVKQQAELSNVFIYPNPNTSGLVYIKGLKTSNARAMVYDLSGALVATKSLIDASINLSRLKAGLYFVEVYEKNVRTGFAKLVRQ